MRRAAKRDRNEATLVDLFKAHGCEVERLNQTGLPDLLIRWQSFLGLVEVKTATGQVRAVQQQFQSRFPVAVVRSEADVTRLIRRLKRQTITAMRPQETL